MSRADTSKPTSVHRFCTLQMWCRHTSDSKVNIKLQEKIRQNSQTKWNGQMDFPYVRALCVVTGQVKCLAASLCFGSVSSSIIIFSSFRCARRAIGFISMIKPHTACLPACLWSHAICNYTHTQNLCIHAIANYALFSSGIKIHLKFTNYNLFFSFASSNAW